MSAARYAGYETVVSSVEPGSGSSFTWMVGIRTKAGRDCFTGEDARGLVSLKGESGREVRGRQKKRERGEGEREREGERHENAITNMHPQ